LKEGETELLAEQKRLENLKIQRDDKLKQHNKTLFYLKRDVLDLIYQLSQIYTVTCNSRGEWTICGFHLPNTDFATVDEEQIATALGYVCHLMVMLAKYLDVPLRYPMYPRCSRSAIEDRLTNIGIYPLYSKGSERLRFEYAVFLLNKNLEQIFHSQKLEIRSLKETLPNINNLLTHLDKERKKIGSYTIQR